MIADGKFIPPPPPARQRVHASVTVPESGSRRASVNLIATWDSDAAPADVEEAIKAAARKAISLYRDGVRA